MKKDFLLEIGTEELPTDSLELLSVQLKPELNKRLNEARLTFDNIKLFTTPRRVVVAVAGLPDKQPSQTVEWTGPAWDKAYDSSGQPTAALQGFLRSKNLKPSDVQKKETPRGLYAAASATLTGKKLEQVLPEILLETLGKFQFAKTMRWDATRFSFPRPIRWIVAFVDKKMLRFKIAGVASSNYTFGHRFLAPRKITVKSASLSDFSKNLRKAHVILDVEERKRLIRKQFAAKAGKSHCQEELVEITAQLVEEPFLISGKFNPDFLSLPPAVLSTSMKKHQKIFAVYDAQKRLKAEFVGVLNGKRNNLPRIIRDYAGVLEAKLRDAKFFYAEDTKERFDQKVARLKDIIFLGKLGNMQEKVQRLTDLAEWTGRELKLEPREAVELKRAATLCKADLLTQMVYEFPELQGAMGQEYARESGEPGEVCRAIADHYLPRSLSQPFAELAREQSKLGSFLAVLDKIDTLVGAFGIGLEPTGSQDPYALRRAGGGIIKILRAFPHRFDLDKLIRRTVSLYGNRVTKSEAEILKSLENFFKERTGSELAVGAGSKDDQILKAVLETSWSDVAGVFLRYDLLRKSFHKNPAGFQKALKVIERTHNILKGDKNIQDEVKIDLLKEPLERKLYQLVEEKSPEIQKLAGEEKFDSATHLYGEIFYGPLHEFFDKILVNVEDQSVRGNRKALMKVINRLYVNRVADLSMVHGD